MPTYQTLLPNKIYSFLDEMSRLYSQIERDMHLGLVAGEKIGNLEKTLQSKYQVDSTTVRNVYHNLKGKHKGIKELKKTQLKDLKNNIKAIEQSIKQAQKRSKKKLELHQSNHKERFVIHQKKRRLASRKYRLAKLNAQIKSEKPSLCFGTKKLFLSQYNLEANGYSNHAEWLADWRKARSSNFLMVGSKTYSCGNQLCRVDRSGHLAITVPPCLVKEFGVKIKCDEIKFRYGQEFINIALTPTKHKRGLSYRNGTEMPVTHRFVRRESKWYLHTTVEWPDIPTISNRNNGAVGVDLNANNLAWAYCDSEGNLKAKGQIDFDLDSKSSGQITHLLSLAIGQIIESATKYECPIIIEQLDFSQKKASLREQGKCYAKMLSKFAYAKFRELVHSQAKLAAIQVIEVNPAYSTLIGLIKYMSLYGLNSGTAAALVLARRGLRFSERLPRVCNALVSPVDDSKHVWTYWARISKLLKGCRRHSYFGMRVRVGVKPSCQILQLKDCDSETTRQVLDAPKILSDASALGITSA